MLDIIAEDYNVEEPKEGREARRIAMYAVDITSVDEVATNETAYPTAHQGRGHLHNRQQMLPPLSTQRRHAPYPQHPLASQTPLQTARPRRPVIDIEEPTALNKLKEKAWRLMDQKRLEAERANEQFEEVQSLHSQVEDMEARVQTVDDMKAEAISLLEAANQDMLMLEQDFQVAERVIAKIARPAVPHDVLPMEPELRRSTQTWLDNSAIPAFRGGRDQGRPRVEQRPPRGAASQMFVANEERQNLPQASTNEGRRGGQQDQHSTNEGRLNQYSSPFQRPFLVQRLRPVQQ